MLVVFLGCRRLGLGLDAMFLGSTLHSRRRRSWRVAARNVISKYGARASVDREVELLNDKRVPIA